MANPENRTNSEPNDRLGTPRISNMESIGITNTNQLLSSKHLLFAQNIKFKAPENLNAQTDGLPRLQAIADVFAQEALSQTSSTASNLCEVQFETISMEGNTSANNIKRNQGRVLAEVRTLGLWHFTLCIPALNMAASQMTHFSDQHAVILEDF
jgi:hypothetical protein